MPAPAAAPALGIAAAAGAGIAIAGGGDSIPAEPSSWAENSSPWILASTQR